jgi:hypothetical protein
MSSLRSGRRRKWWKQSTYQRRLLNEEIAYLIAEGPLAVSDSARRFVWELWRQSRDSKWPTQAQYADRFRVSLDTIQRWVKELQDAEMIEFHRPYQKGKPSVYKLHPPNQWVYQDGWQYRGAYEGWVDQAGAPVAWPIRVSSSPNLSTALP